MWILPNMDKAVFKKINLNAPRPRVDRFVTPRESYAEIARRMLWRARCNTPVDIFCIKYQQQKKYMSYLDEAFGLKPLRDQEYIEWEDHQNRTPQFWPCVPRERTFLSSAESILDLPSYRYAIFPHILDWSSDNILVAALGYSYHKWSWDNQRLANHGRTNHFIRCCKFDPRGEYLLLGTEKSGVELHDHALNKLVDDFVCYCRDSGLVCTITALDWSPTGNAFVIGCTGGIVTSISRELDVIKSQAVVRAVILMVKVSPDARYVAVSYVNGRAVVLLTWPHLILYANLKSDSIVKCISWHPWRSALLGAGSTSPSFQARVALLHAPSGQLREFNFGNSPYCLDCMLFSHKTGELVLSLWNTERPLEYPRKCAKLIVMSDPNRVVDQWGEHRVAMDRMRTMVFSPDGTKLATATEDEDLIIWNFISENKDKKKKSFRKIYHSFPVYLDTVSYGTSLR